jgi:hypothetical protein
MPVFPIVFFFFYERALDIKIKLCGPEHKDVVIAYMNMANLAREMGDLVVAEQHQMKALRILKVIIATSSHQN